MQNDKTNEPTTPSGFFNNVVENLQANKQSSDLVASPDITANTKNSINLMKETPTTTPINANTKNSINLMKETPTPINASKSGVPNIFNVQRSVLDLTKQTDTSVKPVNYDLKTNITSSNLINTDSIEKNNFNINDINNKHKEIMSIEERTKNIQTKQKATSSPPTVINNYSSNDSGSNGNVSSAADSLLGLRMELRSFPAWRTDMG